MAEMSLRVFEQSTVVSYFDADPRLRMSPTAYWRVLQNAAAGHAAALSAATEELRKGGQTWMLSKMRLEVKRHPRLGERVTVETWPSTKIKGARAYRDYVLKDGEGEVCASASSLWVIVDLASRRPVRIPETITALCVDPGYAVPALTEGAFRDVAGLPVEFRAQWSDADQNEHVNNVVMLRWAVDALPLAFLEARVLEAAEVHYLAEVGIGDIVAVSTAMEAGRVRQSVKKGEVVVARVESEWGLDAAAVAPEQDMQAG